MPSSTRLVLFDLHGTLVQRSPSVHETLLAFARDIGYSFAPKAHRTGLRWAHAYWASPDRAEESGERLDQQAFWSSYTRHYLAAMGLPEEKLGEVIPIIGHRFSEEYAPKLILALDAKQLLWQLREQHLKLGLISNQREPLTGIAIELGIIEHFDFTLAAGQIGTRKPDPLFFEQALAFAGGVHPEEAIHVGNNYYTDTIGAQRAGVGAVLFDQYDAFGEHADGCFVIHQLAEVLTLLQNERMI